MGKSHRNNRGLVKEINTLSHHSIRTHNNNCHNNNCHNNSIQKMNCKHKKKDTRFTSSYYGETANISNCREKYLNDKSVNTDYGYKWNNEDVRLINSINTIIINGNGNGHDRYLISSKKQIERRGKIGIFYGHR
jgi:hypothetical protein